MNIGKTLWLAGQIRWGTRLFAREHLFLAGWEVLSNTLHLDGGFRQPGKVPVGSNGVAEEEQVARAFVVRGVKGLQNSQRARARERDLLDPVVLLRLIFRISFRLSDQQRFEIQAVQNAIGDDEDFPVLQISRETVSRQKVFRRLYQDAIECGAIVAGGWRGFPLVDDGLSVALYSGLDFCRRRESKQTDLLWRDRPEVGLFFAQPVEKNCAADMAGDLLGLKWLGGERGSFRQQSKPFF